MPIALRVCLLTFALTVVAPSVAHAGDPPIQKPTAVEALDHLARANKLYNVGSFAEAAVEYKAGALVEPAPIFDFNLGQCYRQLGDHKKAIWHYGRFVKSSPQTPEHVALAQKHIGDEQSALNKDAAAVPAASALPPTLPPASPPTQVVAPALSSSVPAEVEPWYADGLGWGLTATGAVGVIVGSGFLVNASSISDQANKGGSQREIDALRDKAATRQLLGAVIGIGGIALFGTGIVKLAIHPNPRSATAVRLGVSANGLAILGRF